MPEFRQVADGFPETDQVIGGIALYAFEPEYQSEAGDGGTILEEGGNGFYAQKKKNTLV